MGAITCTPIDEAWARREGVLLLIVRRSRQFGSEPDTLANIYVLFLCFDYCLFSVSCGRARTYSMLLNTLQTLGCFQPILVDFALRNAS
jgi:hypothetical protein